MPVTDHGKAEASHFVCEEVIQMLRSTSQRIQSRMKGIADYVAVTRAPQVFQPCRLANVIESVGKSVHVLLKQKRIALCRDGLDSLPFIMGDENRLYSAFYNLVHNAIPEVPAGGSITIRGHLDPETESVVLTVHDTGKGHAA